MKKVVVSLFLIFVVITHVNANTITVKFNDCVDGDTAKFIYNDEIIIARFLAIDTPETKHPTKGEEPYGKEASEYTCKVLKEANEIKLEYDENADKTDKYNRHLVWVFVDGKLLQKQLIKEGLANVAYLYGDYKYTDILEEAEQIAEDNKLGIWSSNIENYNNNYQTDEENTIKNKKGLNISIYKFIDVYKEYILLIVLIFIFSIFSTKFRKKLKKKLKKEIYKKLK